MPRRAPVISTLVVWLALDHWRAPQWLYGAIGLFVLIVWVAFVVDVVKYEDEETDIFKAN